MSHARWLAEGAALWQRSESLRALARGSARPGFAPAAAWMGAAMGEIRGEAQVVCANPARVARVAWAKYALAGAAALVALPAAALAFYAVEVQFVFAVPLALDGEKHPLRASRALVARWGGTVRALGEVLPIAAHMLAGPLRRDPLRAWCEGCLAVLFWYEEARREVGAREGGRATALAS